MSWEWTADYTGLIVSYAYVFLVIGTAEFFRRVGGRSPVSTRKFIHVAVGMWIVGTALLFRTWYLALIPPGTFVIINAVSYALGIIKAMEDGERSNLGTIYFPISFMALIYYFWGMPVLMVASLMPMTWGDAMAATAGRRYGRYRFSIGGSTRSLEGSAAMLLWSWVTTFLAFMLMPVIANKPPINWLVAIIYSGAVAAVCTVVEAVSPWGLDNLTVPAAAALVLPLVRGG